MAAQHVQDPKPEANWFRWSGIWEALHLPAAQPSARARPRPLCMRRRAPAAAPNWAGPRRSVEGPGPAGHHWARRLRVSKQILHPNRPSRPSAQIQSYPSKKGPCITPHTGRVTIPQKNDVLKRSFLGISRHLLQFFRKKHGPQVKTSQHFPCVWTEHAQTCPDQVRAPSPIACVPHGLHVIPGRPPARRLTSRAWLGVLPSPVHRSRHFGGGGQESLILRGASKIYSRSHRHNVSVSSI